MSYVTGENIVLPIYNRNDRTKIIYVCNDPVYCLSETKHVRFMYMSILLKRNGNSSQLNEFSRRVEHLVLHHFIKWDFYIINLI